MRAFNEIGLAKALRYVFFSLWQYLFAIMGISPLRVFLLRLFGAIIGAGTVIERIRLINLYRMGLRGVVIGKNCFLGDGVTLDTAEGITLGDDVTLSFDVMILTHTNVGYKDHPVQVYIPAVSLPVVLRRGCFVGVRSVILPGVTIGEGAAVAAGAIVTKDVSARTLVGGVPAKTIRRFKT
ncbi:MAG: Transferase hexapeptide repeat containing protein [Microgenomates group bacterium GW2011_GWA2_47_8]|nr:MAG: Transferase hexapeptide repeat containing protein [Microgenomates group bacterium GW2011_GWA2_47_8]